MDYQVAPVVMCGGLGSRLWPLSRSIHPKQLLALVDSHSMLQNTLLRVRNLFNDCDPVILCNHEHRFIVAEQLLEVGFSRADIYLEPEGRNTAPAITIAALHFQHQKIDPIMLVMPADHVIENHDELANTINEGAKLASLGHLVTFGVVPNKPETGYGYIERGECIEASAGYKVKRFTEKPSLAVAEQFVASKGFLWNSGIFMFRASTFLQAMQKHANDILTDCSKVFAEITTDLDFSRLSHNFMSIRSESIDFAVMEKAENIAVLPMRAEWSDVGSWDALWEIGSKDESGNVIKGQVYTEQVSNSYLRAEKRLLAVVGLSDIAVIETPDAILVTNKENCQEIKSIVSQLKLHQREEANAYSRVYRPWGYYETLNKAANYHVKHIMVKSKAKLSLQAHQHRAEHWVIIKGMATVTRGEEIIRLKENESVFIPVHVKHRIENETDEPLELIEVQTGAYLEEDDIIRFDDIYGRKEAIAV